MVKITQAFVVLTIAGAAFIAGRAGFEAGPAAFGAPPQDQKEAKKKSANASKQQEMMALAVPREEHKPLALLLGDWEAEVKVWFAPGRPPMTFEETVKREAIFGGRFVMEHVDADSAMGPYQALSVMGYNNSAKHYEMFFIDNGGTAMNIWTGEFDAAKNSYTFTGNEVDMVGKKVKFRTTIDCSNKDRQLKEGFKPGPDGKEYKAFEVTLTRKT